VFSGIVKGMGEVLERHDRGADCRLTVGCGGVLTNPLARGASVAVNGVCLTVVDSTRTSFAADVSAATLAVTTLARLAEHARVNLEPPLKLGDTLDGHLVTGHVDGVGEVVELAPDGASTRIAFELPEGLARYVARKGSVAVDGMSLTVNAVRGRRFEVNVIPHTFAVTIAGGYAVGTPVNIEVDIVARYVERLRGERED
jgi:riboflavin synthase